MIGRWLELKRFVSFSGGGANVGKLAKASPFFRVPNNANGIRSKFLSDINVAYCDRLAARPPTFCERRQMFLTVCRECTRFCLDVEATKS